MFATLGMSFISCSKDDADEVSTSQPTAVGVLSSGTDLDKNLPADYRISSVGRYSFHYNAQGQLEAFDKDGDYVRFENGTLNCRMEDEDGDYEAYKVQLNSKGFIASIEKDEQSARINGLEPDKMTGKATFTYNSNGQLTEISVKTSDKYSNNYQDAYFNTVWGIVNEDWTEKITFTYSGEKLATVKRSVEEQENTYMVDDPSDKWGRSYKWTKVSTLIYDENYPNHFYQYTPGLLSFFDFDCFKGLGELDPFFYIGLLGKASSPLPTGYSWVKDSVRTNSDGEISEEDYSREEECGSYEYNAYGALMRADSKSYWYNDADSRAASAFGVPTAKSIKTDLECNFPRHAHRHHAQRD